MIFLGNAKTVRRHVDACGQFRELRTRFDPHPEHARRLGRREETVAAEHHIKRNRSHLAQSLLDSVYHLRRLLANELQSDMQRFCPHPTHVGSKATNTFQKGLNALPNPIVNIKCNENSHGSIRNDRVTSSRLTSERSAKSSERLTTHD